MQKEGVVDSKVGGILALASGYDGLHEDQHNEAMSGQAEAWRKRWEAVPNGYGTTRTHRQATKRNETSRFLRGVGTVRG